MGGRLVQFRRLLAAAAMGNPVEVTGLSYAASQGDKRLSRCCAQRGRLSKQNDKITISPASSFKFSSVVDAADIPDLIPVLSVLALFNNGEPDLSMPAVSGSKKATDSPLCHKSSQARRDITETPMASLCGHRPIEGGHRKRMRRPPHCYGPCGGLDHL
jgi:hypothetical protein